ncbi:hypothetical protein BH23CHL5_BH23CHL5_22130 [soil metagenome]
MSEALPADFVPDSPAQLPSEDEEADMRVSKVMLEELAPENDVALSGEAAIRMDRSSPHVKAARRTR